MYISKSRLLGLLVLLVVGFLVLRPEDEPSDSDNRSGDSKSATEGRLQPREPAFLLPERDYGVAGRPGAENAPRPHGSKGGLYPTETDTYSANAYPDSYEAHDPYGADAQMEAQGYRFRPLEGQKEEPTRAPHADRLADQYARPYDASPSYYQPYGGAPQNPSPRPAPYPPLDVNEPPQEAYSFRPLEKSPGARGRWQGPYEQPNRGFDPSRWNPWMAPPPPQWGSMPPSQRMYPNLYRTPDRRLTAR
jgi:hypothetical protein